MQIKAFVEFYCLWPFVYGRVGALAVMIIIKLALHAAQVFSNLDIPSFLQIITPIDQRL